jgi:hypothetical protein
VTGRGEGPEVIVAGAVSSSDSLGVSALGLPTARACLMAAGNSHKRVEPAPEAGNQT